MSKPIQFPADEILKALEDKFLAEIGSTFDSRKNRRTLPVWAPRDREFCHAAERANDVLSYEERPDLLVLNYRGRDVFYVVDFRVNLRHSTALVGLSLFGQPGHPGEQDVHELAKAYCARRGEVFVHVPDGGLAHMSARMPRALAA